MPQFNTNPGPPAKANASVVMGPDRQYGTGTMGKQPIAVVGSDGNKKAYGSEHCPKCAEYQMLIGEALAYYIKHKDDLEDKPDTSEVENETESKMDSEKA
jgi:hypothetical protein